jgi:amino acid transporter
MTRCGRSRIVGAVSLVWSALIVLVVTTLAVGAMLAARRRAPEGGYVADGDRAAGVFGVIATGFSVLLGFLIFLAFESYDASRSGAETEALTVAQQVQTAQQLPSSVREDLTGQLVCYARYVVREEWPQMEDGDLDAQINPWGAVMFTTLQGLDLGTPMEEAAFGKWLDQTSTREQARQDRIHGAAGVMPTPLWVALAFISVIVFVFILAFSDSGERAAVQGLYMGSVVAVVTAMLLLLSFLDDPIRPDVGGLQPDAMERTQVIIQESFEAVGIDVAPPCDDDGQA